MEEMNKVLEVKAEDKEKVVYMPNREQRRKMAREQARANKKINKIKVQSGKDKSKLLNLVGAIKEKAIKVKEETGIDKCTSALVQII